VIHIGEVTGNYYLSTIRKKPVWRVSPDGEIRDTFSRLEYVFEMPFEAFCGNYIPAEGVNTYLHECKLALDDLRSQIPELPISNPWIASMMADKIPVKSIVHFGILNSLRVWNFFDMPDSVRSACNVGGFGIDGCLSSLVGASLCNPESLYYCVIGDLAFFYDMNSIGNRHVSNNIRILLVNNGKGTEFRHASHPAGHLGDSADMYVAAEGHYGNKSPVLVKNYVEALGFEYFSASTKEEFNENYERLLVPEVTSRPMVFEVFTDSIEESEALLKIIRIKGEKKNTKKDLVKKALGKKGLSALKRVVKKD